MRRRFVTIAALAAQLQSFTDVAATSSVEHAPPLRTMAFDCGGSDGEPRRDTVAGGSSVRLRIFNDAPAEPAILRRAMERVDHVYSQIRIRTRWTTTDPVTDDGMPLFDVVITNNAVPPAGTTASRHGPVEWIVGAAHRSLHRAAVHYDRIADATVGVNAYVRAHFLADVIAHELGHLLIPVGTGSQVGVMRSDRALVEILTLGPARTFGSRDADVIRRRVFAGGIGRRVTNAEPCGTTVTRK